MTDDGWTRAKKLVKQWEDLKAICDEDAELEARFRDASPSELILMWDKGENEKGEPLSRFEALAMAEAWVRVFGDLPPTTAPPGKVGEQTTEGRLPPGQATPFDDFPDYQIIRRHSAAELLGVGLSTLDRWEKAGKLPNKIHVGERAAGWFVQDLKAAWRKGLCRPDGPAKRKPE